MRLAPLNFISVTSDVFIFFKYRFGMRVAVDLLKDSQTKHPLLKNVTISKLVALINRSQSLSAATFLHHSTIHFDNFKNKRQ